MGRPQLAVGTYGTIRTRRIGDVWTARAYVRDPDGRRREVERRAGTKAAAERSLKSALADRPGNTDTALGSDTRFSVHAEQWLERLDASSKSPNTKQGYRGSYNNHISPALGGLKLGEITVQRADDALQAIAVTFGPGSAKTARSVLRGMLGEATRKGAISSNPIRDTSAIPSTPKAPRALTVAETERIYDAPRSSERARDLDMPDFIDWMLGTGMRIGEVCAVRHGLNANGEPLIDLEAGTIEVNATIIRVTGRGLVLQERTKTSAGHRVLALPEHLVLMLRRRQEDELRITGPSAITVLEADGKTYREASGTALVFLSPRGFVRDPRNTNDDLKEVLSAIDRPDGEAAGPFGWVHSHVFRKTVATRLDEAGVSARVVADVLGHKNPSMTQDVYFGRKVVSAAAAAILARPTKREAA